MKTSPHKIERRKRLQRAGLTGGLVGLALVPLVLSAGCRPSPAESHRTSVARRLIPDMPGVMFRVKDLSDPRLVEEIPFTEQTLKEFWTLKNLKLENNPNAPKGPLLSMTSGRSTVEAVVDIDADQVDVIEIVGAGLVGRASLEWAGAGQDFGKDRKIEIENSSGDQPLWFFAAVHPQWRGKISRLRIVPTSKAKHRFHLQTFRALRLEINPDQMDRAAADTWQVSLDEECRPAKLGPLTRPWTWELDAEVGDHLEFAIGLHSGYRAGATFEIRMNHQKGADDSPIWSQTLDAAQGQGDRWSEHTLPLPVTRAGPVVLEFLTSSTDGANQALGLPVWGSPMIIRQTPPPSDDGTDFNVLLISVDTLRADHVSTYGYDRETTPNLDRWVSNRGIVFENTVASAPWTLPAHYSMFSGLDALNHGVNHGPPMTRVPLVAELFSDRGFSTVAFTGGVFLHPRYGLNRGFDAYRAPYSHANDSEELKDGVDGLIEWLDGHADRRFFALLHTYEVHSPYRPRQPFFSQWRSRDDARFKGFVETRVIGYDRKAGHIGRHDFFVSDSGGPVREMQDDELQLAIDCYDAGVAYADDQIGRLFAYLETQGLFDNTVVIVTSDHGEALGEKGLSGHAYLYDFAIMVPLMISAPGIETAGVRVDRQVRLIDLAPTIPDLAGLEVPGGMDGVSLAPLLRGEEILIPEHAWIYTAKTNHGLGIRVANQVKYAYNNTAWTPAQGVEELYMLGSDPEELTNRVEGDPSAASLRRRLADYFLEDGRGLLIEVNNQSDSILGAELQLSQDQKLIIAKIKGIDIPPNAVEVVNGRTLALAAPPLSRFWIVAEDVLTDSLHVEGSSSLPWMSELDLTIDLSSEDAGGSLVFDNGQWASVDDFGASPSAWIKVWWQRSGARQAAPVQEEDAAMLDQLRALGYVE